MKLKLNDFFFSPHALNPMALCRIIFGLSLAFHYLSLWSGFRDFYGPSAVTGAEFYQTVSWAQAVGRSSTVATNLLQHVSQPELFYALYFAVIVLSLSFAVGFFTRVSGVFALIAHILLHANNEFLFWGWGEMIKPFMAYAIFANSGHWYSIDSWRRERRFFPNRPWLGPAWPVRLIQLHICTVYLVTSWSRLEDPNWLNGSMLYGILTDSIFSRIDSDLIGFKNSLAILCFAAWSLELFAPFGLWIKSTRRPIAWLLIAMHIGLELLTLVGYWNFMMIAALATFIWPRPKAKPTIPP